MTVSIKQPPDWLYQMHNRQIKKLLVRRRRRPQEQRQSWLSFSSKQCDIRLMRVPTFSEHTNKHSLLYCILVNVYLLLYQLIVFKSYLIMTQMCKMSLSKDISVYINFVAKFGMEAAKVLFFNKWGIIKVYTIERHFCTCTCEQFVQ